MACTLGPACHRAAPRAAIATRNGRPAHEAAPPRRRAGLADWLAARRNPPTSPGPDPAR